MSAEATFTKRKPTYSQVHIGNGVHLLWPAKASTKNLANGLVFLLLENSVRCSLLVSAIHRDSISVRSVLLEFESGAGTSYRLLFREPVDVPSTETLHVFHYYLEGAKVECGDCIKGNIQQDKGPFEESVNSVR